MKLPVKLANGDILVPARAADGIRMGDGEQRLTTADPEYLAWDRWMRENPHLLESDDASTGDHS